MSWSPDGSRMMRVNSPGSTPWSNALAILIEAAIRARRIETGLSLERRLNQIAEMACGQYVDLIPVLVEVLRVETGRGLQTQQKRNVRSIEEEVLIRTTVPRMHDVIDQMRAEVRRRSRMNYSSSADVVAMLESIIHKQKRGLAEDELNRGLFGDLARHENVWRWLSSLLVREFVAARKRHYSRHGKRSSERKEKASAAE